MLTASRRSKPRLRRRFCGSWNRLFLGSHVHVSGKAFNERRTGESTAKKAQAPTGTDNCHFIVDLDVRDSVVGEFAEASC